MLVLIAVANAPLWLEAGHQSGGQQSVLDRTWQGISNLLIDGRAYPLFAMLFGFGLALVARRTSARGPVERGGRSISGPVQARKLLRRRGWWLIAFGAVHSLLFMGDILGTYGLIAVLLAGAVAARRRGLLTAAAVVTGLLAVGLLVIMGMAMGEVAGPGPAVTGAGMSDDQPTWPLGTVASWATSTLLAPVASAMVPAVVIGVFIAGTTWISEPHRHTRTLTWTALAGLAIGVLGGLPQAAPAFGLPWAGVPGALAISTVAGVFGGIGWLALIALLVARTAYDAEGELRPAGPVRRLLTAVGTRSMTAYLCQSILFFAIFRTLGALDVRMGPSVAALVAVGVWFVIALGCLALERAGRPGPFETLLRRCVHGRPASTDTTGRREPISGTSPTP